MREPGPGWGGSVKLISALGSDLYGHMIREESTAAGIDMSQCMTVEGHPSSTYMSLLDERGEMYVALSDMSVLQRMDMDFIRRREGMIRGRGCSYSTRRCQKP